MANDHFVAQTYLKHFCNSNGQLVGHRKRDGLSFPCKPADVCREWDGDLNPAFLEHPEALATYRKIFEPAWNPAIAGLQDRQLDRDDRFAMAGFAAALMTCTPAWRRLGCDIHTYTFEADLRFQHRMRAKHGLPDFTAEAVQALNAGEIKLQTDPDYIKAVATKQLLTHAWTLYNQPWTFVFNDTDVPFVTSDNPFAYKARSEYLPPTRFLTITPALALMIKIENNDIEPFDIARTVELFSRPSIGSVGDARCSPSGARQLNQVVVQCAEELIFEKELSAETTDLVKLFGSYRMDVEFSQSIAENEDAEDHRHAIVVGPRKS